MDDHIELNMDLDDAIIEACDILRVGGITSFGHLVEFDAHCSRFVEIVNAIHGAPVNKGLVIFRATQLSSIGRLQWD